MNMDRKALRSSTIIQDKLYVDRDADRQLDAIVDEMGRPGYVLVARQMGKTNLLLRMKRRRESLGEIVLYCDLSTQFESARDLFRYIVDGLLDRIDDGDVRKSIESERIERDVDPNTEYDRHVRLVLRHTSVTRVVIILDEIDSLVGRDYSDRILAQIRSMYFARANHQVYERLTYVLSGVAEPTDLIKDKNISPFNIGEKIYLSDFSRSEVGKLISKAGLNFELDVLEKIYDWASGNPRMTWDICSALEDSQLAGELVSVSTVDAVVERLYLTRHDRPPVDHIRVLAETDRQIRSALISLLYGRGEALDDSARSRLYLAGITSASANEPPRLKNRVIELALSEAWLTQIEAKLNGVTKTASNFYREANFEQAIILYRQFIDEAGSDDSLTDIQLFELAMSQYKLLKTGDAKQTFAKVIERTRSKDIRSTAIYHLASSHLLTGESDVAIPLFQELAQSDGFFKLQARHAITSAYLAISVENNADKIVEISKEVLHDVMLPNELGDDLIAELKAASQYNMAQAYLSMGEEAAAQAALLEAVNAIDRGRLPGLAAMVIREVSDPARRSALLTEVVDVLSNQKPALSTGPEAFGFKVDSLARLIDVALEDGHLLAFEKMLDFALDVWSGTRFEKIVRLSRVGIKRSKVAASALLKLAFSDIGQVASLSLQERVEASRHWLTIYDSGDGSLAFGEFAKAANQGEGILAPTDLILIMAYFADTLRLNRFSDAENVVSFVRSHQAFFLEHVRAFFALYLQHEMVYYNTIKDYDGEKSSAKELLHITSPSTVRKLGLPDHSESLMSQLRTLAHAALKARMVESVNTINRNDFVVVRDVKTGLQSSVKFKKVEAKVKSGEVKVISKVRKPGNDR